MKLFVKFFYLVGFLMFYIKEIILSNLKVAWDVITPGLKAKPGIFALPLDCKSELEIWWLSNLITMTPGTLSVDISTDKKALYIHAMYIDDVEALKRELKTNFERRVIRTFE